jgi:DNA-binding FadR family transcriptional regulator
MTGSPAHRIPKMAEVIAAELRAKILNGDLRAGESLMSEAALMAEYEVSRPTLREALRLLEAQDLVSVRRGSHRGPVVSLPDSSVVARSIAIQLHLQHATLADVHRFRMVIEPPAARMAAGNATPDDIKALREILEEENLSKGDFAAFAAVSWRFHTVLMNASGNATMAVVAESLQHISQQYATVGLAESKDRSDQQARSLKAHHRLVDLVERGAATEAERFWSKHMAAVAEVLLETAGEIPIAELPD